MNQEITTAIRETQRTYPDADYSFAILKPTGLPQNVAQENEDAMLAYFNTLFSESSSE